MKVYHCKKCQGEFQDNKDLKFCPDCGKKLSMEEQTEVIEKKMNWIALVSFITVFFSGLVGLVLGIVALITFKKEEETGKGFAIAGLIIGILRLLFSLLYILLYFSYILGIIIYIITSILGGI